MPDLFGVAEVAELLGVSRQALDGRRRAPDFPQPEAKLASGPVWTREQLRAYARARCDRYIEREEIQRLAAEADDDVLSVEDCAATLGVTPARVRVAASEWAGMPAVWHLSSGELVGIPRSGLPVFARAMEAER